MRRYLTVDFKKGSYVTSITLFSKYTCILGKDSGEGKTDFIADLLLLKQYENIEITASNGMPVEIVESTDITNTLHNKDAGDRILIIDELLSQKADVLAYANTTNNLFICITRTLPLHGDFPLCGIYNVIRTNNWFNIIPAEPLRLYRGEDVDTIITESCENRSEHELLNAYCVKAKAANGRDEIAKVVDDKQEAILVLADLGNIGRAYAILMKRCSENHKLYFYGYQCFEESLYKSELVNGTDDNTPIDNFSVVSLERFYEKALTEKTENTSLCYKHGKPLASEFLDHINFDKLFNTNIGKYLKVLLQKASFNPYDYLITKIGNKIHYLPEASINDCTCEEDCDNLLNQVKSILFN